MSQKLTRKSQTATVVGEEKEKTDSPVKEMKKKIAANAEKEKQASEKVEKPEKAVEKIDKTENGDKKPTEKAQKDDKTEKTEKNDKSDKHEKSDKQEKSEKVAEKKPDKTDKSGDKKPEKLDKSGDKKADKSIEKKAEEKKDDGKGDKAKDKGAKPLNGTHNGQPTVDVTNGTVSDDSGDELVIEEDEVFPELTYDDSDTDAFEPDAPSRSLTRRSQVKVTKTPETPRPASEKESEDSKESKLLKLNADALAPSDRKLRSADSPKPESKKEKKQESPKKPEGQEDEKKSPTKKDAADSKDASKDKNDDKLDKDADVIIIEPESTEAAPRTRARVSPYTHTHTHTHSHTHAHPRDRLERTHSSAMADYTGNNSTMEMDITESSSILEDHNDSGYLRGLRGIRGRTSYKLLSEIKLTNPNANRPRPIVPVPQSRPTGAVVGRKRKPSDAPEVSDVEVGVEAEDDMFVAHGKRMRLLDRIAMPFRRNINRRAAEIVGINSDLPLTAPVASSSTFDPESIKPAGPVATPLPPPDLDNKRCVVM